MWHGFLTVPPPVRLANGSARVWLALESARLGQLLPPRVRKNSAVEEAEFLRITGSGRWTAGQLNLSPAVSDEEVNRRPIREAAMVDFTPWIHVKYIDGTALVMFPRTDKSEGDALAVGGQLSKLAERPACRRFVLNLSLARCLSSLMLGKLIAFQKNVRQRGGKLTLCSPSPEVAAQFERLRLDQLFHICSTEEEALADIPRANAS